MKEKCFSIFRNRCLSLILDKQVLFDVEDAEHTLIHMHHSRIVEESGVATFVLCSMMVGYYVIYHFGLSYRFLHNQICF